MAKVALKPRITVRLFPAGEQPVNDLAPNLFTGAGGEKIVQNHDW